MVRYNVISADGHLECSPMDWVQRMPAEFRDKAPRVVKLPSGGDGVIIGDGAPAALGLNMTGGQKYTEYVDRGRSYADRLPGTGDPAQRCQEMDRDGTDGEVLYAAVVATAMRQIKDPRVLKEIAKAYNSWLSDYCSYAPDRLFGAAVMPPTNSDDAVEELERVAKYTGIRLALLLSFPNGGTWATVGDEKFWNAANEIGMCITAHHNFGGDDKVKSHPLSGEGQQKALEIEGSVGMAHFAWLLTCDLPLPTLPILTIEQLFLGGVFDRNPKLRLQFGETGIGWLPYWLEQMDDRYDRHHHWARVNLKKKPSEYVREHVLFCFQEDHAGVRNRDLIGVDNIAWASDFPHAVSDWPYSRETRERQFANVPDPDRRKMEALNVACQLGLITKAEKEQQALVPINKDVQLLKVAGRGERRR